VQELGIGLGHGAVFLLDAALERMQPLLELADLLARGNDVLAVAI